MRLSDEPEANWTGLKGLQTTVLTESLCPMKTCNYLSQSLLSCSYFWCPINIHPRPTPLIATNTRYFYWSLLSKLLHYGPFLLSAACCLSIECPILVYTSLHVYIGILMSTRDDLLMHVCPFHILHLASIVVGHLGVFTMSYVMNKYLFIIGSW